MGLCGLSADTKLDSWRPIHAVSGDNAILRSIAPPPSGSGDECSGSSAAAAVRLPAWFRARPLDGGRATSACRHIAIRRNPRRQRVEWIDARMVVCHYMKVENG
jgi:hypothetical protein